MSSHGFTPHHTHNVELDDLAHIKVNVLSNGKIVDGFFFGYFQEVASWK